MNKKSLSSLELAAIINELQILINGKISQIYHQEKKELLFQTHSPGRGKQLLKIVPGKYLCFTNKKEVPLKPSSFCMQLRKYLDNASIKAIYQKGSERIIVLELEKTEKYFLIIELFSKGNLILTDEDYKIIGLLEQQTWKERTVKAKEKYIFPTPGFNWKEVSEKELKSLLEKSNRKNLATSLATEFGLGGLYAEEICKINEIYSKKLPGEVESKEINLIVKTIKKFLNKIEKPKGHIYEDDITPFPLTDRKTISESDTYSEAIDTLNPFKIVSPYEKKIKMLEKTISQQQDAIVKLEEKIELNKRKGELIYEKYSPLQKLLDIVNELKKIKEWNEIGKELKKEKKIKKVDLKEKRVVVDL
ncbi:MAG: NFACT family protein [Nanoarchaeota archaeon]|nr:NFACT family protein [Nanoarchaeota archaeon]MBU1631779.1 NFACT family protein [Nanoarchaeota archaeon]MBU1876288.1 NFACT family protein [Nanoarchaeota archaeon]